MTRMSWDEYFLGMADGASARSTCSRLRVGAIVVSNYNVLSSGYNGAPKGVDHCVHEDDRPCRISVHAEANALVHLRSRLTPNKVMYVTHAPCWECAKLIINADIKRVVFSEIYRSDEGLAMLDAGRVQWEHKTENNNGR